MQVTPQQDAAAASAALLRLVSANDAPGEVRDAVSRVRHWLDGLDPALPTSRLHALATEAEAAALDLAPVAGQVIEDMVTDAVTGS